MLKVSFPRFTINIDPQEMSDAKSMHVNLQIHRGLFRFLPNGDIIPDLAENWKYSKDKKKLFIKLRKDITFSDGTKIEPINVILTFARLFNIGSSISADLGMIRGIDKFKKSKKIFDLGIKKTLDDEVEFSLKYPSSVFLKLLATVDCSVLKITEYEQINKEAKIDFTAGAGPYLIKNMSENKIQLSLWRSDKIISKKPPTEVEINLTDEIKVDTLVKQFKVDTLDQYTLSESDKENLMKQGWRDILTDLTKEYFLIFNPKKIKKSVRSQLINKINVDNLSKKLSTEFVPAYGLIPPVLNGSINEKLINTVRSDKIKESKESLTLYYPDNQTMIKIISSLKTNWSELSIKINYKKVSVGDWSELKINQKYDIILNARSLDYPDGISVLNYFKSGVAGNNYFISDKNIDKLLEQASAEFDIKVIKEKYIKIQMEILKKKIVFPLVFGTLASGYWGPKAKYIPPHPLGFHFLPFELIEM